MKTRLMFFIACLSWSVPAICSEIYIGAGDLVYQIFPDAGNARVIGLNGPSLQETIKTATILSEVSHEGKSYPVTSIGTAFSDCPSLESVSIPNSIVSIEGSSFSCCPMLKSISLPPSVTRIGPRAFEDCTGLTSIAIPDGVNEIERWCFSGCSSLSSVRFGNAVGSINPEAFRFCSSLKSLILPPECTSIGAQAFEGCSLLENVTFNEELAEIGISAFDSCTSLKSIVIPPSVQERLGNAAFRYCDSLVSVVVGDYVPVMGSYGFQYCKSLKTVVLGSSLREMGYQVFQFCPGIESVTVKAVDPPFVYENETAQFDQFDQIVYDTAVLTVPAESIEAYRQHEVWGKFRHIQPVSGIDEVISDSAFDVSIPVDVYLLSGEKVFEGMMKDSSLQPGTYIIRQGNIAVKKIVR